MKSQSSLKIALTPDNHYIIEANCENHLNQNDEPVPPFLNQPQPIITANSNLMICDSNASDILSISKTDSNISIYSVLHQKEKADHSSSNLLISFSNISEADPKLNYKDTDSLSINLNISSNSIICKKERSKLQKSNSFTPSTLCNYYLRSNDATPNKGLDINMFNQSIKQTNLNLIYSAMNNTNIEDKENSSFQQGKSASSKKNIFNFPQDKKTPIKYTKSQLKNEGDSDIEGGKKNLMLLFNEGEDNVNNISNINEMSSQRGGEGSRDFFAQIHIKENGSNAIRKNVNCNGSANANSKGEYKIETINNFSIEKVAHPQKEITFPLSPNNYSNFSFDITRNDVFFKSNKKEEPNAICNGEAHKDMINLKGIPRQSNGESNGTLNWASGNSNYVSPKFINRAKLNDSTGKVSTIQSTTSEKKKERALEDNNQQSLTKAKQREHGKYISSFTLPINHKSISPQSNEKIILRYKNVINQLQLHSKNHSISPKSNSSKQAASSTKTFKRNFSFLKHYANNNCKNRPSSASKSRSKEKRNTSTNSNRTNETPKSIGKQPGINLGVKTITLKDHANQKPQVNNERINISLIQKIKEETSTNLINFINTLKPIPALKETLSKLRKSPSPPSAIAKPKAAQINIATLFKNNFTEGKHQPQPITKHNIQTSLFKCEDASSANTTKLVNNSRLSTQGKDQSSHTVVSNQKKQAKVIQNFSNYKKKTAYQKHFASKKEDANEANENLKLTAIISNKLKKLEGDEDMNILIEDY